LPWIRCLLDIWCAERALPVRLAFMPDAVERVLLHEWPDNLRGLNRLVHRVASTKPDRPIGVRLLGELMPELLAARPSQPEGPLGESAVRKLTQASGPTTDTGEPTAGSSHRPTREEFLAVYEATGHSVRATSKHFGRDRRQIYRWLESFGIERGND
jgi:transcriptional regulator of acetoin/glycerol metabolism